MLTHLIDGRYSSPPTDQPPHIGIDGSPHPLPVLPRTDAAQGQSASPLCCVRSSPLPRGGLGAALGRRQGARFAPPRAAIGSVLRSSQREREERRIDMLLIVAGNHSDRSQRRAIGTQRERTEKPVIGWTKGANPLYPITQNHPFMFVKLDNSDLLLSYNLPRLYHHGRSESTQRKSQKRYRKPSNTPRNNTRIQKLNDFCYLFINFVNL